MNTADALGLLCAGPDGIRKWNELRDDNAVLPSLAGCDLCECWLQDADLTKIDLANANLTSANLIRAKLVDANLERINLCGANLSEASLQRATLAYADLSGAAIIRAFLMADLRHAKLNKVMAEGCNLMGANLESTEICDSNFSHVRLRGTGLRNAVLHGTNFGLAMFFSGDLTDTDFRGCRFHETFFGEINLSAARNLEDTKHGGPSTIGANTMLASKGKIPESFLKGCGVPDSFITFQQSLVSHPFEFYKCFISYSTDDEEFATRLHNDLQAAGIRCWKWNVDAKTGRSLWSEIDQAIRTYDKLVLVASKSSLTSPAVNREIERALVQEDSRQLRGEDGDVLFPIRIDGYIFKGWEHERKVDVTKKVVADGREWDTDPAKYRELVDKLIMDLRRETVAT